MWIAKAMDDVMEGKTLLTDAHPSIQSCLRLPIYQKAVQILELPTKQDRCWELEKAPPLIRPFLEEEILRIWEMRKEDGKTK